MDFIKLIAKFVKGYNSRAIFQKRKNLIYLKKDGTWLPCECYLKANGKWVLQEDANVFEGYKYLKKG